MLYKKGNSVLYPNNDNIFEYEFMRYLIIDKTTITLDDSKFLGSEKYIEDKVKSSKTQLEFINLISAPKDWLLSNNFEEVPDDYGMKKKFLKK